MEASCTQKLRACQGKGGSPGRLQGVVQLLPWLQLHVSCAGSRPPEHRGLDGPQDALLPESMYWGRLVSHRQVWVRLVQQQGGLDEVPADQEGDSQSLAGNKSPGQLESKIGSGQTSDAASQ